MNNKKTDFPNPDRFKGSYDLEALANTHPELKSHLLNKILNEKTIDFSNPLSVYHLNKALLLHHFQLQAWNIPNKYLIPGIPGRAAYIYKCAQFLAKQNGGKTPMGSDHTILDIGTGANMVYPIVGIKEYGWSFVGTDIEQEAIDIAKAIADINPSLKNKITFRLQETHSRIFDQVVNGSDNFILSICNPPFHNSAAAAKRSSMRKQKNLKYKTKQLNFRGSPYELWCKGGEFNFISNMIRESSKYKEQIKWFSTLISNYENIEPLMNKVERLNPKELDILKMETGNKKSRILIWGF